MDKSALLAGNPDPFSDLTTHPGGQTLGQHRAAQQAAVASQDYATAGPLKAVIDQKTAELESRKATALAREDYATCAAITAELQGAASPDEDALPQGGARGSAARLANLSFARDGRGPGGVEAAGWGVGVATPGGGRQEPAGSFEWTRRD